MAGDKYPGAYLPKADEPIIVLGGTVSVAEVEGEARWVCYANSNPKVIPCNLVIWTSGRFKGEKCSFTAKPHHLFTFAGMDIYTGEFTNAQIFDYIKRNGPLTSRLRVILREFLGPTFVPKTKLPTGRVEVTGGKQFSSHRLIDVSAQLGISPSSLSRFVRGLGGLSEQNLDNLFKILDLDLTTKGSHG